MAKRPRCSEPDCDNLAKIRSDGKYAKHCNSCHRNKTSFRKHKKTYCENNEGALGFVCTTTIVDQSMLVIDHFDSNKKNVEPDNLKTFCAACHNYKTKIFKDYLPKKKRPKS